MDERENHDQQPKNATLVQHLIQKIDAHPDDFEAYYDLAALLIQLKSYLQAEELLVKALKRFDKHSQKTKDKLMYGLGNVYYAAGNYQKAIAQFSQINAPQLQIDVLLMTAQSYMGAGNHKMALTFALTAAENRQQDPVANRLVADNLLALGHFEEAASYFDRVLVSQPQNGRVQFERGLIAMILNENAEAYFNQARLLDPEYFSQGQQRLAKIQESLKTNKPDDRA